MKKLLALLLFVCMLAVTLCACKKNAGTDGDYADEQVFRQYYSSELSTFNYLQSGNENTHTFAANVMDTLVEYDKYGIMRPSLATEWKASDDQLTWTFTLRQGVKWYDYTGKEVAEVTAQDFVDAAAYLLDAKVASECNSPYFVIKNAEAYFNGEVKDIKDVGVKAVDTYTLEFTLEKPTPYFLSSLAYVCFLPVYGPFLEECGDAFGTDNTKVLYNGAYIVTDFSPEYTRTYSKNENYWDKENVFIEKLEYYYNKESTTLGPEAFKRGEIDLAEIPSSLLTSWLNDDATKELVSPVRSTTNYSYFYCFNFDPHFDAKYEPDNWKLAVNNENFRKALTTGLDRIKAMTVTEPYAPETRLNNTICAPTFASVDGKDYTQLDALKGYTDGDSFNEEKAKEYAAKAKEELTKAGATFPIKVLMPYNPTTTDWGKECEVVAQQIQKLLGDDFVQFIVEAGPDTGFLAEVRRSGKYAFMKCNWGSDYADPQTYTDPFTEDNTYNFMDKETDAATSALVKEYLAMVNKAKEETTDMTARYELFAKAEAFLIEHAFVLPYSLGGGGYQATKLDVFEGQYAPFGFSNQRYKGQHVYSTAPSIEQYKERLEKWQEERAKALEEANK